MEYLGYCFLDLTSLRVLTDGMEGLMELEVACDGGTGGHGGARGGTGGHGGARGGSLKILGVVLRRTVKSCLCQDFYNSGTNVIFQ